jgi:hypothetical protein
MRVLDPFGFIDGTVSFASDHYYAPGTLLFIALVVLAHVLAVLALIGAGVTVLRRVRERLADRPSGAPVGTLSRIPAQRAESSSDHVI